MSYTIETTGDNLAGYGRYGSFLSQNEAKEILEISIGWRNCRDGRWMKHDGVQILTATIVPLDTSEAYESIDALP